MTGSKTGTKTGKGRFFDDYVIGETIRHAIPRTLSGGERALYHALYPARGALYSSDAFAQSCGLTAAPLDDMIVFHTVFGKTVPDISVNARANLGYAECRWLAPVWPGDTLSATSEVIGKKPSSNGKTGILWVRTTGQNQHGVAVLSYVRWVLVWRDRDGPGDAAVVPHLAGAVAASDLVVPAGLDFSGYDFGLAGEPFRMGDYAVGEVIDHVDAVVVEEADHLFATRLWQNTARVHFDTEATPDKRRLIYGGHVISLARALSFRGLANAQTMVAINGGSHVAPCYAGDRLSAWSEVLDSAPTGAPGVGAMRLRLVATTSPASVLREPDGKYMPGVLLDLDYWALMPL